MRGSLENLPEHRLSPANDDHVRARTNDKRGPVVLLALPVKPECAETRDVHRAIACHFDSAKELLDERRIDRLEYGDVASVVQCEPKTCWWAKGSCAFDGKSQVRAMEWLEDVTRSGERWAEGCYVGKRRREERGSVRHPKESLRDDERFSIGR
jgi:hypothetical protein